MKKIPLKLILTLCIASAVIKTNAQQWTTSGNDIYSSNSGNVGIGTNYPLGKLHVNGDIYSSGTLHAGGIDIFNLTADSLRQVKDIKLVNGLCINGTTEARIYSNTSNLFLQDDPNFNYNTIINAANSGYVGIGTSTPTAKLEVAGTIKATTVMTAPKFSVARITSTDSVIRLGDSSIYIANNNHIYWTPYGNIKGLGIGNGNSLGLGQNSLALGYAVRTGNSAQNSIILGSSNNTIFTNSVANSLMIGFNSNIPTVFVGSSAGDNTTGNVGIGTSTPEDKLQVNNGAYKLVIGSATGADLGYGTSYIGFNSSRQNNTWNTATDGQNNGGGVVWSSMAGYMYFATLPSTGGANQNGLTDQVLMSKARITIDPNGHVGIGTTAPNPYFALSVKGNIISEEVQVALHSEWPDYVFESSHKMLSLDDLELYLKENKHLPNIPSAENVYKTGGISLGDMQTRQLEKTEELYLYIIELYKELKDVRAQNIELKEEIDTLK